MSTKDYLNLISGRHGTQVIYMELRGVVESWIIEKLFAVFYDIEVMNAEVFAKGLEKCRLLTRSSWTKCTKNWMTMVAQKFKIFIKTDSLWNCSSYLFRQKTRASLCREEK